ncbi:F-box protein At2g26850-like [Benincasa hispida]|uniref:F-box protein At2g26850-like n=1 Tax=Benincasa hispida TaxID=102211 RepID=UPI0018FF4147|nr:F-box protein At2g26850-like [Benincasa hispida]
MFYLLISFLSFILLSKSFSYKRLLPWEAKMSLLTALLLSWFHKSRLALNFFQVLWVSDPPLNSIITCSTKLGNLEEGRGISLLDLPKLALESILDRLSPSELCKMANVCTYLRDVCEDDYFWEKHMKQKWGNLMGNSAYKEWHLHIALKRRSELSSPSQKKGLFSSYFGSWSLLIRPKSESRGKIRSSLPIDSMKAWYQSLESGKLWFPAQVYNRESGHAGFILSCYDAQISYDSQTNMFKARYPPHGRRAIEENILWNRLRAPPVDIPPHVLHVSECLADLKPGDHVEIQWRKSKEFSYGWWYGVVGHLGACDGSANNCHCCCNDNVMLEFSQYSVGSRWRKTVINRKSHKEVGNEADGYYGGLRKLYKAEEITRWKCLWPNRVLE